MAHASGRGGTVADGEPLATADALAAGEALAIALAVAGGYEIGRLGRTVEVAGGEVGKMVGPPVVL